MGMKQFSLNYKVETQFKLSTIRIALQVRPLPDCICGQGSLRRNDGVLIALTVRNANPGVKN